MFNRCVHIDYWDTRVVETFNDCANRCLSGGYLKDTPDCEDIEGPDDNPAGWQLEFWLEDTLES